MRSTVIKCVIILTILSLHKEKVQGQEIVNIPTCPVDEFLTSNGTDLYCRSLPDVGFCDCPDLIPVLGSGDVATPTFPLPPPVFCDYRFEFFTAPHNPYSCGEETEFAWEDSTKSRVQGGLPGCSGIRHRAETLYPNEFYLPAPCYGLTDQTTSIILTEFQVRLEKFGCTECSVNDTFLRCPNVPASARFYTEINADSYYGK